MNIGAYLKHLQKKYDIKKVNKKNFDFQDFVKNNVVIDQITEDCGWVKDDHFKRRKKIFGGQTLDDDKFEEKTFEQLGFDKGLNENERENLLLKDDRNLTMKNKKLIGAIKKVND